MKSAISVCLLTTSLAMAGMAAAEPTITAVTASVQKNEPGKAEVKIVVNGKGLDNAICALRVNHGDGTSTVRQMDWSKKVKFPLVINKTYTKPGTFRVSVLGVKSGMYLKCLGQASTKVTVEDMKPATEKSPVAGQ